MTDHNKIWDLQKSIYKQLRKKAKALEGEVSTQFKNYEKNQRKYAKREFIPSTLDSLYYAIEDSHVVYLGDFHSFDQNTKNLERLTRRLLKQEKKFSLGVELIDQKYQEAVNAYVERHITELELLEMVEYHESWRFPWAYYRPFFQMAKEHSLPIIALNTKGGLLERDQNAAEKVGEFFKQNPNQRLLILFGELHIVPNKLPKLVKKKLNPILPNFRQTIIHQNLDEVYWKLRETNIEKYNQVVLFSKNEFSLQTAPPWIKYESMIYWYENLSDDPEFEIHDYILNNGVFSLHSNVPENFVSLCHKIQEAFNLNFSLDQIEDFNLYSHQNLSLINEKINCLPKKALINFFNQLLKEGRVFKIPFSTNYYCSAYSINRISFLAGLHLLDISFRSQNIQYDSIWSDSNIVDKFLLLIKQSTVGFLASKTINPFRKCDLYLDFKIQDINNIGNQKNCELIINAIEKWPNYELKDFLKGLNLFSIYEFSRSLGFYWGEILFDKILIKNPEVFKETLKELFNFEFKEETFHQLMKLTISGYNGLENYKTHKKRFF